MPQALDGLLRKGFRFVTTSQLISLGNQYADAQSTPAPEVTAAAEGGEAETVDGGGEAGGVEAIEEGGEIGFGGARGLPLTEQR